MGRLAGLCGLTVGVLIFNTIIYVSPCKGGQGIASTGGTAPKAGWPWAAGQQ